MSNKINVDISKLFIPHPMQLFIFGTYKENGDANLGLFSWLNFCWDGELAVMLCLDGEKLTKERIKKTNIFSANIVTGQSKVCSANKQVNFLIFNGNLPAGNYFSYG